jgi:hypothetical protein
MTSKFGVGDPLLITKEIYGNKNYTNPEDIYGNKIRC